MSELYVKYSGLAGNIEELKKWKTEFNEAIDEFRTNCLAKIAENIDSQTGQYRNIENN